MYVDSGIGSDSVVSICLCEIPMTKYKVFCKDSTKILMQYAKKLNLYVCA